MADGVNDPQIVRASDEHAARTPLPAVALGRRVRSRRVSSPHKHRFRAATGVLLGIAIAAVVVAVIAAGTPGKTTQAPWSAWQPPDTGTLGAWEIANHIAPFYRFSSLDQLDVATVVKLADPATATATNSSSVGLQLAVTDPTTRQASLLGGKTIAFNLCGVGTHDCTIKEGQPSAERFLLLKREALELSLYTLKYLPDIQNVVTIFPPGYTVQLSSLTLKPPSPASVSNSGRNYAAVLYGRREMKPFLQQPVAALFPEAFPPTVAEMPKWIQTQNTEASLVSQISASSLFSEHIVAQQDGSSVMFLNPQPPQ